MKTPQMKAAMGFWDRENDWKGHIITSASKPDTSVLTNDIYLIHLAYSPLLGQGFTGDKNNQFLKFFFNIENCLLFQTL